MYNVVNSIEEFNGYFHQPTLHPLMSVGNLSQADLSLFEPTDFNMYCVVLMDANFGELVKSGTSIRYQSGTIFSVRPGQVISMNLDYSVKPQGWMLAFRPELLEKSGLGRDFYMFSFFSHDVNEALTLSQAERGVILNSYANICAELQTPNDYLTNHMLRLGIGHLLSYCKRFFERQFSKHNGQPGNLCERMDKTIDDYLSSCSPAQQGPPTVAWLASQFNLSPNYFGNLVKHEIHITAHEYIQRKIIAAAQSLLIGTTMTVNEIAEELGFDYPNHFTRLFKRNTGMTPLQFKKGNVSE